MSVVMSSISRSTVDYNSATLRSQRSSSGTKTVTQKLSFVPDEDVCHQNVVLLRSTVLHELLDITNDL